MRILSRLFFSLIVFSINACADKNPWFGNYSYEAAMGENAGGDQVIVEYDLKLQDSTCEIDIEGYQTSESIVCTAKMEGDSLNIYFKSYSDGSIKNVYDVEVYPVGSLLFKLSTTDKGLITHWENLVPDESTIKDGIFFVRSK